MLNYFCSFSKSRNMNKKRPMAYFPLSFSFVVHRFLFLQDIFSYNSLIPHIEKYR